MGDNKHLTSSGSAMLAVVQLGLNCWSRESLPIRINANENSFILIPVTVQCKYSCVVSDLDSYSLCFTATTKYRAMAKLLSPINSIVEQ